MSKSTTYVQVIHPLLRSMHVLFVTFWDEEAPPEYTIHSCVSITRVLVLFSSACVRRLNRVSEWYTAVQREHERGTGQELLLRQPHIFRAVVYAIYLVSRFRSPSLGERYQMLSGSHTVVHIVPVAHNWLLLKCILSYCTVLHCLCCATCLFLVWQAKLAGDCPGGERKEGGKTLWEGEVHYHHSYATIIFVMRRHRHRHYHTCWRTSGCYTYLLVCLRPCRLQTDAVWALACYDMILLLSILP